MPYSPGAAANSLLDVAKSEGRPLDPMKIQKLVYFSHAWHLAYDQGPLSDEQAQAWRWGPVFPSLYNAVKIWGSGQILEPVGVWQFIHQEPALTTPNITPDDTFALEIIERVWEVYGRMSGWALSQLTHEEGGPWATTYTPGALHLVIQDSVIHDCFASKLQENKENQS